MKPKTDLLDEISFLLKHSVIYGLGTVLSRAVAFVLLPFYTRYLTPTDYGVLELIDATSSMVGIIIGLGVSAALSRFYYDLPPPERRRLVTTAYALLAAIAAVVLLPSMLVSAWLAERILGGAEYTRHFQVAFASLLLGIFIDLGQAYLRLLYRSREFIAISTASLIIGFILNVLFITWFHLGVFGVLLGGLVVRLIIGVPLTLAILHGTGRRFSVRMAQDLLTYSMPLIPSAFGTFIINYADRYLLTYFGSLANTGIFGLATKLSSSVHLLVTSPFVLTFLPRRFQIAQRPDAPAVLSRVYDLYLLSFLVPATLLSCFVQEIMMFMTTPAYYHAGDLVPILLLELVAIGSKYHVEFGILHSKQTRYYLYSNAVAAATHLVLAFVLIRAFGVWGAAVASLVSSTLQTLLLHLAARRLYCIPFHFSRGAKLLGVATVVVLIGQVLPAANLAVVLLVKLPLSVAFIGVALRLNDIRLGEISRLRGLFGSCLLGDSRPEEPLAVEP